MRLTLTVSLDNTDKFKAVQDAAFDLMARTGASWRPVGDSLVFFDPMGRIIGKIELEATPTVRVTE